MKNASIKLTRGFEMAYKALWRGPERQTSFILLVNRFVHLNEPKRRQSGGRLPSFWCSTLPSADIENSIFFHSPKLIHIK